MSEMGVRSSCGQLHRPALAAMLQTQGQGRLGRHLHERDRGQVQPVGDVPNGPDVGHAGAAAGIHLDGSSIIQIHSHLRTITNSCILIFGSSSSLGSLVGVRSLSAQAFNDHVPAGVLRRCLVSCCPLGGVHHNAWTLVAAGSVSQHSTCLLSWAARLSEAHSPSVPVR